jgi:hypothetical protein
MQKIITSAIETWASSQRRVGMHDAEIDALAKVISEKLVAAEAAECQPLTSYGSWKEAFASAAQGAATWQMETKTLQARVAALEAELAEVRGRGNGGELEALMDEARDE